MHNIIYYSTPVIEAFRNKALQEIKQILNTARTNNEKNGITGALLYTPKYFIQILEGEREALRETLTIISKDPRHTNIKIAHQGPIDERNFSKWTMAYIDESLLPKDFWDRYSTNNTFSPEDIKADAWVSFFNEYQKLIGMNG